MIQVRNAFTLKKHDELFLFFNRFKQRNYILFKQSSVVNVFFLFAKFNIKAFYISSSFCFKHAIVDFPSCLNILLKCRQELSTFLGCHGAFLWLKENEENSYYHFAQSQ